MDLVLRHLPQPLCARPVRVPGRLGLCGADAQFLDEFLELLLGMKGLAHALDRFGELFQGFFIQSLDRPFGEGSGA